MAVREALSVIIFAYNEGDNIRPVLSELLEWLAEHEPDAEVVFVNDGSSDHTLEVAGEVLSAWPRHQLLSHEMNRGIGASIKTAVTSASGAWLSFLPADGQVPPASLGMLRNEQQRSRADVVFSVYDNRDDGVHRKVLSWGVRALIRGVHGVRLRSDGPYLFQKRHFVPAELPPDTFFLNFEFPIRALRCGLRSAEVTIPCRARLSGSSKSAGLKRVVGVARDLIHLRLRAPRDDWAAR